MGWGFQYTPAVWRGFFAFGKREHKQSCLISTSGNSANTDLIRQAKVVPTLETNKPPFLCSEGPAVSRSLFKLKSKCIFYQIAAYLYF